MYTTNITGFLHWCCGSSFTNDSTSASRRMLGVTSPLETMGLGERAWLVMD
jgi:hypothetical protein